jgi:hypothetical protein
MAPSWTSLGSLAGILIYQSRMPRLKPSGLPGNPMGAIRMNDPGLAPFSRHPRGAKQCPLLAINCPGNRRRWNTAKCAQFRGQMVQDKTMFSKLIVFIVFFMRF